MKKKYHPVDKYFAIKTLSAVKLFQPNQAES